jgi:glyoxylase-like metal-dependent hydrolase (beta-lactamase superfamily II)
MRNNLFLMLATTLSLGVLSCSQFIDTHKYSFSEIDKSLTASKAVDKVGISIIESGEGVTQEGFLFSGGNLLKERKISHIGVLIKHPKGDILFDTGLGTNIEEQFERHMSFVNKQLFKFTKKDTIKNILTKNNFDFKTLNFILISHLHFDHASGIKDFPKITIWTTKEEYKHAMKESASKTAFFQEQYNGSEVKWNFLRFNANRYENFNESYDVYNDGSIVIVALPGHTKGSLGVFVNLKSGKRYFFTGDTTWAREGFERPSEKFFVSKAIVDTDVEKLNETIVQVHNLMKQKPEVIVIPAHDAIAQEPLAKFPTIEY